MLCSVLAARTQRSVRSNTRHSSSLPGSFFTNLLTHLFQNFTLNQQKKSPRKVWEKMGQYNLADDVTALTQLYASYSDRARYFN